MDGGDLNGRASPTVAVSKQIYGYIDIVIGEEATIEKTYEITSKVTRIGRELEYPIRLHDARVSRSQCELIIEEKDGQFEAFLKNLTKRDTTQVDGAPLPVDARVLINNSTKMCITSHFLRWRPQNQTQTQSKETEVENRDLTQTQSEETEIENELFPVRGGSSEEQEAEVSSERLEATTAKGVLTNLDTKNILSNTKPTIGKQLSDQLEGAAEVEEDVTEVEDAAEVKEVAAEVKEDAAEVKEVAAEVKEDAAEVKEVAAEVEDAAEVKEVAAEVKEDAAEVKEEEVMTKRRGRKPRNQAQLEETEVENRDLTQTQSVETEIKNKLFPVRRGRRGKQEVEDSLERLETTAAKGVLTTVDTKKKSRKTKPTIEKRLSDQLEDTEKVEKDRTNVEEGPVEVEEEDVMTPRRGQKPRNQTLTQSVETEIENKLFPVRRGRKGKQEVKVSLERLETTTAKTVLTTLDTKKKSSKTKPTIGIRGKRLSDQLEDAAEVEEEEVMTRRGRPEPRNQTQTQSEETETEGKLIPLRGGRTRRGKQEMKVSLERLETTAKVVVTTLDTRKKSSHTKTTIGKQLFDQLEVAVEAEVEEVMTKRRGRKPLNQSQPQSKEIEVENNLIPPRSGRKGKQELRVSLERLETTAAKGLLTTVDTKKKSSKTKPTIGKRGKRLSDELEDAAEVEEEVMTKRSRRKPRNQTQPDETKIENKLFPARSGRKGKQEVKVSLERLETTSAKGVLTNLDTKKKLRKIKPTIGERLSDQLEDAAEVEEEEIMANRPRRKPRNQTQPDETEIENKLIPLRSGRSMKQEVKVSLERLETTTAKGVLTILDTKKKSSKPKPTIAKRGKRLSDQLEDAAEVEEEVMPKRRGRKPLNQSQPQSEETESKMIPLRSGRRGKQ